MITKALIATAASLLVIALAGVPADAQVPEPKGIEVRGLVTSLGGFSATVNAPLFCPSSARIFSAVGIELCRNPMVVVTTRTFLGAAWAAGADTSKPASKPDANKLLNTFRVFIRLFAL